MNQNLFAHHSCRQFLSILIATSSLISLNAVAAEPTTDRVVEKHEKAKTRSSGKLNRPLALKALRAQKAISQEDYRHVKGASASQAALVADLHAEGIEGGLRIWLLEDSGINGHPDVLKYIDPSSDKDKAPGFTQKQDHGAAMASLVHQMAPKATLVIKHQKDYLDKLRAGEKKPFIINASFNTGEVNINDYFGPVFRLGFSPLIVKSAGNDATDLSMDDKYKELDSELQKYFIVAGNLRQDGRPRASSGVPGHKKEIQDRFLWVVADDMLVAGGPTGSDVYKYATGTSGAAAILSGAAAIIKNKYPQFGMAKIAECLLESANRDLFGLFGDGYHAIHVVEGAQETLVEPAVAEEESKAASGSSASSSRVQMRTIMYNPAQWGKGVLNVRNAMIYADLRSRFPSKKPGELRRMMLDKIVLSETKAATKIQQWWKANKKSIPESEKPLPLVVDPTIPDRTYPEAEGKSLGRFIPEPDPLEAGKSEGLVYEGTAGASHKTAAEIRRERESLKAASKNILDQLKEGLITLEDLKGQLSGKGPKDLLDWFNANPSILDYQIGGKLFLSFILSEWDWSSFKESLLQGVTDHFSESYKLIIKAFVKALGGADYVYFPADGLLKRLIDTANGHKDLFEGNDFGKLLLLCIHNDSSNLSDYLRYFTEGGYDPLAVRRNDGSTLLHLIRDKAIFRRAFDHYTAKGISGGALLNDLNNRRSTPFGTISESLGFSAERNIEMDLGYYLERGARFIPGMYSEGSQMSTLSIFIRQTVQPTEVDRYDGQYDVVSYNSIKDSFLSLKDRAFIFDFGVDKDLKSLNFYGLPQSVVDFILEQDCTSKDQWIAIIDEAWGHFDAFLKAGHGKTFRHWDDSEKPCMVEASGKVFYNTSYSDWPS